MNRSVKTSQRASREIDVILTHASLGSSLGTAGVTEGTYQVTAKVAATGTYTVAFNKSFTRAPRIVVNALDPSAKLFAVIVSRTTAQCVVQVYSDAGTATACTELHLAIRGWDSANQN